MPGSAAGRSSIEALGPGWPPCAATAITREPLPRTGPKGAISAPGRSRGTFVSTLSSCAEARLAPRRQKSLPAQAELLDQRAVPADVSAGQVLEQPPAAANKQQQPATAVVIVLVHFQVLGQISDPPSKERNLDFRRTGVTLIGRVPGDDLVLHLGVKRQVVPSVFR